jgi:hypothetical protein
MAKDGNHLGQASQMRLLQRHGKGAGRGRHPRHRWGAGTKGFGWKSSDECQSLPRMMSKLGAWSREDM